VVRPAYPRPGAGPIDRLRKAHGSGEPKPRVVTTACVPEPGRQTDFHTLADRTRVSRPIARIGCDRATVIALREVPRAGIRHVLRLPYGPVRATMPGAAPCRRNAAPFRLFLRGRATP